MARSDAQNDPVDLFIIGGGINGCGIARDAAGRGLSVALAEMGDLGQATSSASTKLFHGGLRYLEYFEFRLVREALKEREVLLKAMPHISWPMRFVLPVHAGMRFESDTPTSRLLSFFMPWMKGRRPAWLIRLGLMLYDTLGGRQILPGARRIDLNSDAAGKALRPGFDLAFEYSDCWVQDARLVVLNARDARARGADIMVRTKVVAARREGDTWAVTTQGPHGERTVRARALVNAGGPWVDTVIQSTLRQDDRSHVRLVRGSHIVTRRLFDHDRCYFFQGTDGRIIFAIPYEQDFTLIGTTDQDHHGTPSDAVCTPEEQEYLCSFASDYFRRPVTRDDIVWTYSGVRPLYNDGASSATAATRDYVLKVEDAGGAAPLLNVFGGKITTYRRLAEHAMQKLAPYFEGMGRGWTAGVPLPGGDFRPQDTEAVTGELARDYPFLGEKWAQRMIRHYGLEAREILDGAGDAAALGRDFGATLSEAEVRWLMDREWAQEPEDVIWRRTKLGLRMSAEQIGALRDYMAERTAAAPAQKVSAAI
ncbi:putative FAD-dependent glycerol-3-phosphate dehydrogenase [Pseudooceanicola batsensis HTCC2597]|uniref:Glycerol-3-phosphate dehydrogenase n=1 Tax=Pseudooceanicola batsensis (strain ATCC BAA-863 / DSM 15984 / KCTC 12145 / HTCC2597) TaxID=252305 RepID=A3TYT3_PSEBH|nr:glycerol-3-phosphate dehydrogenase [Pseudooceanicola batsensis]EAQ02751.1 putative FAD-dependent glycerol-3-phosphate dehydrogenase [Pseudooceanicola batsensis HTCC2597]